MDFRLLWNSYILVPFQQQRIETAKTFIIILEFLKRSVLKPNFTSPDPRVIGTWTLPGFLKHYFTSKYEEGLGWGVVWKEEACIFCLQYSELSFQLKRTAVFPTTYPTHWWEPIPKSWSLVLLPFFSAWELLFWRTRSGDSKAVINPSVPM